MITDSQIKENSVLADGAIHEISRPHISMHSENSLDPSIEARLTDVVKNLRGKWVEHIAAYWGDIHPICESSVGDFDKRISTTIRQGFLCFSQFLCCLELFLLDSKKFGIVTEERVLRLEKFIIEFRNNRRNLIEAPYCQ